MSNILAKSIAAVGSNTFVSRVLGLVRDVVIASSFGASAGVDAFIVAFRLPNLFRRLFAEGAFSQAFVPVLSDHKTNKTGQEVRDLVAHVAGALGTVLLLITVVGVFAAPLLVLAFAPGFQSDADKFALAIEMARITFPYLLFISLTALAGAILNTYGRFAVPAFTPVLLNVSLIAAAVLLAPQFEEPIVALAWGVLFAGIAQLSFQLPFLARLGLLVRPRLNLAHTGVVKIARLMVPAILGVSVAQINILIDTLIASFLVTGSVTWLYYADRMVEFPLGVFGIALATVILPALSQRHAQGSAEQFSQTIDWALRLVVLISVPAAVALCILAIPILSTLFQYGEFLSRDVQMTSLSLMAYSVGLIGFVGVKVLAPGFYARQDMRTPVRIALIAMFTNLVLNLIFVGPFAHAGLALATGCAALLNASLLLRGLLKAKVFKPLSGWPMLIVQVIGANIIMAIALRYLSLTEDFWFAASLLERVLYLSGCVLGGLVVYVAGLLLLGVRLRHLRLKTTHREP